MKRIKLSLSMVALAVGIMASAFTAIPNDSNTSDPEPIWWVYTNAQEDDDESNPLNYEPGSEPICTGETFMCGILSLEDGQTGFPVIPATHEERKFD